MGRLQRQTENLFPEVSYNLINSIYPNLLTDIPSITLLKFETDTKSQQKIKFKEIPSRTKLYVKNTNGIICLHNSWTPTQYILMDEQTFLSQNNTLANILKYCNN